MRRPATISSISTQAPSGSLRDAEGAARMRAFLAEDLGEQFGAAVGHQVLFGVVGRAVDQAHDLDDALDPVQVAERRVQRAEQVDRDRARGLLRGRGRRCRGRAGRPRACLRASRCARRRRPGCRCARTARRRRPAWPAAAARCRVQSGGRKWKAWVFEGHGRKRKSYTAAMRGIDTGWRLAALGAGLARRRRAAAAAACRCGRRAAYALLLAVGVLGAVRGAGAGRACVAARHRRRGAARHRAPPAASASLHMADGLAAALEGRDIVVTGVVASLPQRSAERRALSLRGRRRAAERQAGARAAAARARLVRAATTKTRRWRSRGSSCAPASAGASRCGCASRTAT